MTSQSHKRRFHNTMTNEIAHAQSLEFLSQTDQEVMPTEQLIGKTFDRVNICFEKLHMIQSKSLPYPIMNSWTRRKLDLVKK